MAAFSGVHLCVLRAGAKGVDLKDQPIVMGPILDSEVVASGAGTVLAPATTGGEGVAVFRLRSSAQHRVDIGETPNSAVQYMIISKDDGFIDIGVEEGHSIHVTADV